MIKKNLYLGLFVTMFLVLFSISVLAPGTESTISDSCTDTDGGKNYYEKGTATMGGTSLSDHCNSDNSLTEKYCSDEEIKWVKYECLHGCENGACISEAEEYEETTCGDSKCMYPEDDYNCRKDCLPNCGDGVCQDYTCMAYGCPYGETSKNCPEDCEPAEESYCEGLSWEDCELNKNTCWWSTCDCLPVGQACNKEPCKVLNKDKCTDDYYAYYCWWSEDCNCLPTHQSCTINIEKPDLKVDKIEYKLDNENNPTKIFFYATIVNIGNSESSFFDVNVQIPQLSVFVKNTCMNHNLLPGETCIETGYGFRSDEVAIKGKIDIIAIADPRNNIEETNEKNNKFGISLYVGAENKTREESISVTEEDCPVGCECYGEKIICEAIPIESKVKCETGCKLNNRCVIQGTRTVIEDKSSYCGIDGIWHTQKETNKTCMNNYECTTNFCSDGECYDIKGELQETKGILEGIMDFLRSLFGFK
ncbi:MAG: hypothetical protein KAT37_00605 [Candidatus Aenigmarchaeota archaeon]|nr:hypothetical protein [Candidatus Aenigmarchaeota archaeon]